jgi:hypothetical protein
MLNPKVSWLHNSSDLSVTAFEQCAKSLYHSMKNPGWFLGISRSWIMKESPI